MSETNTIDTVRALMIEQLRALRAATPENLQAELQRAKGMSEVTQTLVNSAKVEVEYLQATEQEGSTFLGLPPGGKTTLPGPGNGITSITRHRMEG